VVSAGTSAGVIETPPEIAGVVAIADVCVAGDATIDDVVRAVAGLIAILLRAAVTAGRITIATSPIIPSA
jgi:hypothetical protein